MEIVAKCPQCDAGLPIQAADAPGAIKCGGCGRDMALSFSESVKAGLGLDRCPVCGGADFYGRKDFDPKMGLTVVIIGIVISAAFYWFKRDLIAYSILAAATLVDLVIYQRLKDLSVCYRCHTEFRGPNTGSSPAFDLHTADVLEMEYERKIGRR